MAKKTKNEELLDLDIDLEEDELDLDDDEEIEIDLDDEDEEEEIDLDDEDEEEVKPAPKKSSAKKPTKKVEEEEEDDEEEEEEIDLDDEEDDEDEEEEVKPTSKKSSAKKPTKKVEDEEEDDEEEEEVKPASKKSSKKSASASKETPKKSTKKVEDEEDDDEKEKTSKKSKKSSSKKEKNVIKAPAELDKTYEELIEELVVSKVNNYNEIMEKRNSTKKGPKPIPPSKAIGLESFYRLLQSKAMENKDKYAATVIERSLSSLNSSQNLELSSNDIANAVNQHKFTLTDMEQLCALVFDTLFDVLVNESGIRMFNNEDCNFHLRGEWTEEKIYDNETLPTDKITKVDSYLSVKTKSPAPKAKITQGKLDKKGNFKPLS